MEHGKGFCNVIRVNKEEGGGGRTKCDVQQLQLGRYSEDTGTCTVSSLVLDPNIPILIN